MIGVVGNLILEKHGCMYKFRNEEILKSGIAVSSFAGRIPISKVRKISGRRGTVFSRPYWTPMSFDDDLAFFGGYFYTKSSQVKQISATYKRFISVCFDDLEFDTKACYGGRHIATNIPISLLQYEPTEEYKTLMEEFVDMISYR